MHVVLQLSSRGQQIPTNGLLGHQHLTLNPGRLDFHSLAQQAMLLAVDPTMELVHAGSVTGWGQGEGPLLSLYK